MRSHEERVIRKRSVRPLKPLLRCSESRSSVWHDYAEFRETSLGSSFCEPHRVNYSPRRVSSDSTGFEGAFQGSRVTSDAGLLLVGDGDERVGVESQPLKRTSPTSMIVADTTPRLRPDRFLRNPCDLDDLGKPVMGQRVSNNGAHAGIIAKQTAVGSRECSRTICYATPEA
jgi:hypothetical protein